MISPDIRALINRLHDDGNSYRSISKIVCVSPNSVRNIVLCKGKENKSKRGQKTKLKQSQMVSIKRCASKLFGSGMKVTANKVKNECDLTNVTTRTVQRSLLKLGFSYKQNKQELILSKEHKQKRVHFARFWIESLWPWHKVVWSDEKRFNLDGPDSWSSWVREGKNHNRNKRQQGGQSMQIWGMVLPDGRLIVKELEQRSVSNDYISLLRDFVKPFLDEQFETDYVFQQDNASFHVSKLTLDWMRAEGFPFMEWPARSPDLSPIENVWSLLASLVYDGPQFNNLKELRIKIKSSVEILSTSQRYKVMSIRDSIQSRLLKVIESKGDKLNY